MMKLRTISIAAAAAGAAGLFIFGIAPALAQAGTRPLSIEAGQVRAVNGSTSVSSCGSPGQSTTVTLLLRNGSSRTLVLANSTSLIGLGTGSAAQANLCVGDWVTASGTRSGHVLPMPVTKLRFSPPVAFGSVDSVNGSAAAGSCGSSGTSGTFTVQGWVDSAPRWTVTVGSATLFCQRDLATAAFANLCVGDWAAASGTVTGAGTLIARRVGITTPRVVGDVRSVNGVSGAGTCGSASSAGSFTITGEYGTSWSVAVTPATIFTDGGSGPASVSGVCAGDAVAAFGTASGTRLAATAVAISAPFNGPLAPPSSAPPATKAEPLPDQPQPILAGGGPVRVGY
ncbi:MAG: DUF5666 domain-containing protein [Candidatus Dormibacteria bacterium]